ncbi:helix-turn-helix domain-containing protein [Mycobacteroides abscessus]|uniref:helix-turn-helix domain-containing protein n=1 Tax=Mycobacteroides abscessus TaxID=36809 RepID=UPI00188E0BAA|nr:helix-turn-helix domain-containing protein [Mycobacteroides abscessus]
MITGLRDVVLLDSAEAAYLSESLTRLCGALSEHGLRPSARLSALQDKLAKACASASDSGRDTCVRVRDVGDAQHSGHAGAYDLLDSAEAATILGCTPANVRDLARRGRLAAHRAGRGWVYPARAVIALAERRAVARR